MHNESTDAPIQDAAPSKLKKFVRHAPVYAAYTGVAGVVVASTYMGLRTQALQMKAAELALEVAQNAAA